MRAVLLYVEPDEYTNGIAKFKKKAIGERELPRRTNIMHIRAKAKFMKTINDTLPQHCIYVVRYTDFIYYMQIDRYSISKVKDRNQTFGCPKKYEFIEYLK